MSTSIYPAQLYLYESNHLDLLKSLLSEIIKQKPLSSPFKREKIMVQSYGMSQWLKLQLADDLNMIGNVDFPFMRQAIWSIYCALLPELPKKDQWTVDMMQWRLMALLPEHINDPELKLLRQHIDFNDQKKCSEFFHAVASLFDQYMVFRPDWLERWEDHKTCPVFVSEQDKQNEQWQSHFWRLLMHSCEALSIPHRQKIHYMAMACLQQKNMDCHVLPERFILFGISSIPAFYLEFFTALSQHIPIHIFHLNPCRELWDSATKKGQQALFENESPELFNPLLLSWGMVGRDYHRLLMQYNMNSINPFADYLPERSTSITPTLLQSVQQSILDLYVISRDREQKIAIQAQDHSIQKHICHSPLREVEVLYDYLLHCFDNDPELTLSDVIVMMPNVDEYAPYIQAIFDNAPAHRSLPYAISDRQLGLIDPLCVGFDLLLQLPQKTLDLQFLFDLLSIAAIRNQFDLSETEIQRLQTVLVDSGTRWGTDPLSPYSLTSGLQRIFLGYMMESDQQLWEAIAPYDQVQGMNAIMIGKLADLLEQLIKWKDRLVAKTIQEWQSDLREMISTFFAIDETTESSRDRLLKQINVLIENVRYAKFEEVIECDVIQSKLQRQLENNLISNQFLMGKLNICTLVPMRSVPFKIVAILGMNDGDFPRKTMPPRFDLMAQHYQAGDRNKRNEDHYLLLEALLSAQQSFYVSYIGRNIKTNKTHFPSVLVNELFDFIDDHYQLESLNMKVSEHLTQLHPQTPYHIDNFKENEWQSYADEWLPPREKVKNNPFSSDLSRGQPIEKVTLTDLTLFYTHSICYFLKKRLQIFLRDTEKPLPEAELFTLDNLEKYKLKEVLLNALLDDPQRDELTIEQDEFEWLYRSNQIPGGLFGHRVVLDELNKLVPLKNAILEKQPAITTDQTISLNLLIQGQSILFNAQIPRVGKHQLVRWRSGKLRAKDWFTLTLEHVVLLAAEQPIEESYFLGIDNSEIHLNAISAEQAKQQLETLIEYFILGHQQPLFLPLECFYTWLIQPSNVKKMVKLFKLKDSLDFYAFLQSHKGRRKVAEYLKSEFIKTNYDSDDYYRTFYAAHELTNELFQQAMKLFEKLFLPFLDMLYISEGK